MRIISSRVFNTSPFKPPSGAIFLSKDIYMPMVGKKKFPYTEKGKKEANDYAKKSGMKKPAKKK